MSRLFLTNIDLNNNQLIKAVLSGTAPSSIVAGSIWYDTTGNTIKVGTGSGTSALLTKSGSIVNADLSGSAGITNANLANSSVTVNGTSISLGASATVKASTTYALGLTSGGNLAFSSGTTWDGGTTGITIGLSATPTGITSINGISISGSSGTFVTSATTSLPNVTSVGTLSSLTTSGDVVVGGNLTVNGTVNTINSTTVTIDDKNIELGSVATPTDVTADGGGITLKGATDKTFNWVSATGSWTSSENIDLASGKVIKIAGTQVLSASQYTGNAATVTNGVYTTNLGTNVLTALGVAVGSAGAFVVNGGALGTPSSGTLTNATGLPVSTGISGLGTGVATALGNATGGTGGLVTFGGALGAATATSINKVAITAPATSATLTIADGKTLTASNTLTFAGTDGSTLNIGAGGTLGTGAYATIGNYAPLASPALTGTPTAPTATNGTNTTQIATTAFVQSAINAIGGGVAKYAANNGAITAVSGQITWTVNHALATTDVIVQIYRQSDKALVDADIVITDSNNVTITMVSGSLAGSEYRVVVLG